jgi:tripartite-type tricarboxylate transporter receptor subunit TctC
MRKLFYTIAALMFLQLPALAQIFTKPIYVHVSVPAGGVHDIIHRLILTNVSKHIGQPIVVMNNDAASGIASGQEVLHLPADGYNWYATFAQFTITPSVLPGKMDPHDFRGVAVVANTPMAIVANPKYKSIDDLKNSTELYDLCPALGSISCFLNGKLTNQIDLKSKHVMYGSVPPALLDMSAGRLDWSFTAINVIGGYKDAGTLNVLATAQENVYPEVKSLKQLGYTGFNLLNWDGILVRKETSDDIVIEINKYIKETLSDPELIASLKKMNTDAFYLDNKQFDALINKELEVYK